MKIKHLNPDTMYQSPVFSQAVSVEGASRLVYVGGQNAVDKDGKMVGGDDIGAQSEQALKNLLAALDAAGAKQENVVKLTIYLAAGHDVQLAYAAAQKVWGAHPTAISGVYVAGLTVPGALVEIDAVAAL